MGDGTVYEFNPPYNHSCTDIASYNCSIDVWSATYGVTDGKYKDTVALVMIIVNNFKQKPMKTMLISQTKLQLLLLTNIYRPYTK